MFFFVMASNVLNYVSIATKEWNEGFSFSLWESCVYPTGLNDVAEQTRAFRPKCFLENPPALIATGTALNCLSLVLIFVGLFAVCLPGFRDSFALYFVIGSELTTLLSLVFNTTGWYFVFFTQYQNIFRQPQNDAGRNFMNNMMYSFKFGWSFWLMTPSFGSSVIAAVIGSAILGCTCVTNKIERDRLRDNELKVVTPAPYLTHTVEPINKNTGSVLFPGNPQLDAQVLRL